MKNIGYILIICMTIGCTRNRAKSYSELETIVAYYEIDKQYKPKLPPTRSLLNKQIENELQKMHPGIKNLRGIGTWTGLEMDTTRIKHFNLSLLQGEIGDTLNYLLITSCKQTDTVIYSWIFNDYELELIGVYPHSSKTNKDGIRVEFIRDLSTKDSTIIQKAEFEIPESTGIPTITAIYNDSEQVFYKLSSQSIISGRYESITDSIHAILEIKDPQEKNTIPYRFIFKSKGNCHTFLNSNFGNYKDSEFYPHSNISIKLTNGTAIMTIDKWTNHCEEEISLINEMKKVDNKG